MAAERATAPQPPLCTREVRRSVQDLRDRVQRAQRRRRREGRALPVPAACTQQPTWAEREHCEPEHSCEETQSQHASRSSQGDVVIRKGDAGMRKEPAGQPVDLNLLHQLLDRA